MTAHIKILILNWNGKHLLKPCLDSIKKIDYSNKENSKELYEITKQSVELEKQKIMEKIL